MNQTTDGIQRYLAGYAHALNYDDLPEAVIHAAKVRIIDALGGLIGGFFGEPSRIVRNLGIRFAQPDGASIIGTRAKITPDMAAFVNGATARYLEINDVYHQPASYSGHPSDLTMPVLSVAEHARASGRDLIAAVVLGYEVFIRFCDAFHNVGFDNTNFTGIGVALASGKLLGLNHNQLQHCISMTVTPNVILRQARLGPGTMYKAVAAGQQSRAGVFAALMARSGMEGPNMPFEGKSGWCANVARQEFSLDTFGSVGVPFKLHDTYIRTRPANSETLSSIIAAEKIASQVQVGDIKRVTVETYKKAKERMATGEHHWHPQSAEAADHSIPYVVAAALLDGTVSPHTYDDTHLHSPKLRALMQKIKVVENPEFTRKLPHQHCTRVTISTVANNSVTGESGGDKDDLSTPKSDAQISEKFRSLAEDYIGSKSADSILVTLWSLDDVSDVSIIPPMVNLA